ncbi:DUF3231 family protein [Bacillus sp. 31A1R]|uniref:DUF3231 family protein n=1 Tax=Robertmurraya mangrovi TaxID=3098077 RepID=A0ABU5IWH6_9BACI|nr:DUF3231 family protein [Bacillus sp. 31A1R]MDZ5471514.1 DUF3231 family protein [Bacillus sp. 31A1R]
MEKKIDLTASEMGYLWTVYQSLTMNICILKYYSHTLEDDEVRELNSKSLSECEKVLGELVDIFEKDGFPIPVGFSDSDVNTNAAKLYTDPFILYYQWFVHKGNLNYASIALNTIARDDVVALFSTLLTGALKLLNESRKLLLDKGLWIRSPYIPIPKKVTFVEKQSFLNGWIGEQRPLVGQEISANFYNIVSNQIGFELMNSFIQVIADGDLKRYIERGKEIASKHVNAMSKIFIDAELPVPSTWSGTHTDSRENPFSEKLILNMISYLNAQGIANYGMAISNSIRRDVSTTFSRLAAEVGKYAEDGTNLLIEKGWFESPPQASK